MISDEELECMASTEAQNSTVAVVRTVAEMAQELLAYREAERKSDMLTDSAWIAGAKFGEFGPHRLHFIAHLREVCCAHGDFC